VLIVLVGRARMGRFISVAREFGESAGRRALASLVPARSPSG
jgi:hypothetical protein